MFSFYMVIQILSVFSDYILFNNKVSPHYILMPSCNSMINNRPEQKMGPEQHSQRLLFILGICYIPCQQAHHTSSCLTYSGIPHAMYFLSLQCRSLSMNDIIKHLSRGNLLICLVDWSLLECIWCDRMVC
jgi:hypothetical protein